MPPNATSSVGQARFAFFGTKSADFTPVPDITRFRGLGDMIGKFRMRRRSTYVSDAWNDFLEMYIVILQQQAVERYVSVTWAEKLHSVVLDIHQFAQEIEKTHWFILRVNFLALEKQANEFKHKLRVLRIGMAFHSAM